MSRHDCIGECDCCGRSDLYLHQVWFCGLETWACAECRGEDPDTDQDEEDDWQSLKAAATDGPA